LHTVSNQKLDGEKVWKMGLVSPNLIPSLGGLEDWE